MMIQPSAEWLILSSPAADDTMTVQTNLKITSRTNLILTLSQPLFTILLQVYFLSKIKSILEYKGNMFENLELQWCAKCKVKHHQLNPRNPTFVNSIALGPWSSGSPCVPSGIGEDKSKS